MNDQIKAALEKNGLTVKAVFVPFSKSRNAGEKSPSLNWRVTLQQNGRDVLTTDYSAGCGHTPAYKNMAPNLRNKVWGDERIRWECENGKEIDMPRSNQILIPYTDRRILPDSADVIYSLLMDSEVIDYASFEDWASEFGYETDSRKAEGIYNACMKIALQFRRIGESTITELRDVFQDY